MVWSKKVLTEGGARILRFLRRGRRWYTVSEIEEEFDITNNRANKTLSYMLEVAPDKIERALAKSVMPPHHIYWRNGWAWRAKR